jgi:hypothetical protein
MKKETLEEAAKKYIEEYMWEEDQDPWFDFMEGAKWQQERSYSEKEILEMLRLVKMNKTRSIFETFEQFKKK